MAAAATSPLLLLLLSLCAAGILAGEALPQLASTVHDLLPEYGLPRGLLPASVTSYSMTGEGEFLVELAAPCYVQFTDLVYYDRSIRGRLSYGAISDLSGIQVKKVFVWLPVTGMAVVPAGDAIAFQVGFLSQDLPISLFADIPTCKKNASGAGAGASSCRDGEHQGAAVEAA